MWPYLKLVAKFFPKVSQKIIQKCSLKNYFSVEIKSQPKYLGYFLENIYRGLSEIAQSGHTAAATTDKNALLNK